YADASKSWRRLAALHREMSRRSGGKTYFLSFRDVARAFPRLTHQAANDINHALERLGVIKIVRKGKARPTGGQAAEFRYILPPLPHRQTSKATVKQNAHAIADSW